MGPGRSGRHLAGRADDRIDELLAAYQAECAAARAAVAGLPLDTVGRVAPMDGGKTLRYALVQVIQETARHTATPTSSGR